jgi:processive 1,2-diacylglycerol beta-glucosyltransferase
MTLTAQKPTGERVLIIYGSTGHGHRKAAEAIAEAFEYEGTPTHCIDLLAFTPSFFGKGWEKGYLLIIQKFPWLWGLIYHLFDLWVARVPLFLMRHLVISFMGTPMKQLVENGNYSAIVSTFLMGADVPALLRRQGRFKGSIVTVLTDYAPHELWLSRGVDRYVVALPETKENLIRRGVPSEITEVLGIPVAYKFSRHIGFHAARTLLGIKTNVFTILLTSGGAAIGNLKNLIEGLLSLTHPLQILVICGNNHRLYQDLHCNQNLTSRLHVYGFVHNMEIMMEAANVIIGKGGGLTISEALAKQRLMIIYEPVPGQETRNARYVEKVKAGYWGHSAREVIQKVRKLVDSSGALEELGKGLEHIARPSAASTIVRLVKNL